MSSQLGETNQVLGGDSNKYEVGGRKRNSDEELSLLAAKSLKPNDEIDRSIKLFVEQCLKEEEEEIAANINLKLPPELLSAIFRFLPFSDLKNALLVCR